MVPDKTMIANDVTRQEQIDSLIEDDAIVQEHIESLTEENEKLREAFKLIKERHQAKVKECNALAQERDRLSKYPVLVACMVSMVGVK